ncbi:ubiquitin-like protein 4A [Plodia interpunctella]|uniref:ubiquitin-like protein 4A n=1 Tax=Plodia interpunctella TaxID=58824 RepID=UPI0023680158|nr:ubiquitin-like protein 4A [Plodia interpunctella]
MKVTVKKLQGGECTIEALPTTSILDIKRQIFLHLKVPVEEQKLLLLGRTLADDQTVQGYPIKDGTKLNLVVKKPEGLYEVALKYFKKLGMTDTESVNAANRLLKISQEKFNKLSWDDIDRLCRDCLLDESGQSQPAPENEPENDDIYSL